MTDTTDDGRSLDWATTYADSCQQRYGEHLCPPCVSQGRARCALAEYACRLVDHLYGAGDRSPMRTDETANDRR